MLPVSTGNGVPCSFIFYSMDICYKAVPYMHLSDREHYNVGTNTFRLKQNIKLRTRIIERRIQQKNNKWYTE